MDTREITLHIEDNLGGKLIARTIQIMSESGCHLTDAVERAQYEEAHNLLPTVYSSGRQYVTVTEDQLS